MSLTDVDWNKIEKVIKELNDDEEKNKTNPNIIELNIKKKYKKINTKFCFNWDELLLEYKINRAIEYANRFTRENSLTEQSALKLRKELTEAIVNKNINIEYDKTKGIILNVNNLLYKEGIGYYIKKENEEIKEKYISKVSKVSLLNKSDNIVKIVTK